MLFTESETVDFHLESLKPKGFIFVMQYVFFTFKVKGGGVMNDWGIVFQSFVQRKTVPVIP